MSRAQVDASDRHGQTPLFFAPTREMCKLLMENRADVNRVNAKGQTALHLAGMAEGLDRACRKFTLVVYGIYEQFFFFGWLLTVV